MSTAALQKLLKRVNENLTCVICLSTYTDAKVLACGHSFCRRCIRGLLMTEQQILHVRCPYCRMYTILHNGVQDLNNSFPIQQSFEFRDSLQEVLDGVNIQGQPTDVIVKHTYTPSTTDPRPISEVVASIREIEKQQETMRDFHREINKRCEEIRQNEWAVKTQITEAAKKLIATVEEGKDSLIKQLERTTRRKLDTLSQQENEIKCIQDQLSRNLNSILNNEVPSQGQTCSFDLNSMEQADTRFCTTVEFAQRYLGIGYIYSNPVCPEKCILQDVANLCSTNTGASSILQIFDRMRQTHESTQHLISCKLVSSDGTITAEGTVISNRIGQYKLCYTPPKRGQYQLEVKVEGQHIQGSPFSVAAVKDLPTCTRFIEDLKQPWGITTNKRGQIIVAEFGNDNIRVLSANAERTKVSDRGMGSGQLLLPRGVAVDTDDNIVVADGGNHRIQKFSPEGCLLGVFHLSDGGFPTGIGINPFNNQIFVTESSNHYVQVLDTNLFPVRKFGTRGSDDGMFQSPQGVAFDRNGNCFVADCGNNRVQVFTMCGEYVRKFETAKCTSIVINSDIVYIADMVRQRISLFSLDGFFLISFKTEGNEPEHYGMTVNNEQNLLVTDRKNNRILVFSFDPTAV